jgi:uncharacterized protein (DUF488 family)
MEVYTIGFTRKSAEEFFAALRRAGARKLVDVRLNNTSQLSGFAKKGDLAFFLRELCGAEYVHEPSLAPTRELLDAYSKGGMGWEEYERRYLALLESRKVEERLERSLLEGPAVLLCSEPGPERCHRRLAAEYLERAWGGLEIIHL